MLLITFATCVSEAFIIMPKFGSMEIMWGSTPEVTSLLSSRSIWPQWQTGSRGAAGLLWRLTTHSRIAHCLRERYTSESAQIGSGLSRFSVPFGSVGPESSKYWHYCTFYFLCLYFRRFTRLVIQPTLMTTTPWKSNSISSTMPGSTGRWSSTQYPQSTYQTWLSSLKTSGSAASYTFIDFISTLEKYKALPWWIF